MASIGKWGRPLVLLAALGLLGSTQVGCGDDCIDSCTAAYDQCIADGGDECGDDFDVCYDICDGVVVLD